MSLLFCTTNNQKFKIAELSCKKLGISLDRLEIEVDEVQSADPKYIIHRKAEAVFKQVKRPLLVSDDAWSIPSLGGFPGAYMKDVNSWFTVEDWLLLMKGRKDRRIMLEQRLAYIDQDGINIFEDTVEGQFLDEASSIDGVVIQKVVTLTDDKQPLNEIWQDNPEVILEKRQVWPEFLTWYKQRLAG